jgi:predicted RNA-binding protein
MSGCSYWLDLFTGRTWRHFIDDGAEISGFRERRWNTVQKIKPGDKLICYLTGVSRFIGLLEVISEPYKDSTPIWEDEVFPCRVRVKPLIKLEPETAIPVHSLKDKLSFFQNLPSPNAWTGWFRGSPYKWKKEDAQVIVAALTEALENPIHRPVDPKKLERRPRALKAKKGVVSVPDDHDEKEEIEPVDEEQFEIKLHTEIQYLLLKLGREMGFDVWIARNDRNREAKKGKLSELFNLKDELPLQFDEATTKTIEYIDVLWLTKNAIVAAFEIESTTSIYSGLLRMSDLLAMQPNINIPLYIVAPDDRRDKVFVEVNRPTFARLNPPLSDMCKYISFSSLEERLKEVAPVIQYLKPEFLDELSEVCELEEP